MSLGLTCWRHTEALRVSSCPPIQSLIDSVNEIAVIGEYRRVIKKEGANLTRRVKLLAPLFEELKECRRSFSEKALTCISSVNRGLRPAKEVLRFCQEGSKIYLVLERETIISRFLVVKTELEQLLDGLPYNALEISDGVREQVELVHSQLKSAKARVDIQDAELYSELAIVRSENTDRAMIYTELGRLAEKLGLKTISELKQESRALHEII
eukprot:c21905_g2_i2 orf=407-1042(+)